MDCVIFLWHFGRKNNRFFKENSRFGSGSFEFSGILLHASPLWRIGNHLRNSPSQQIRRLIYFTHNFQLGHNQD